MKYGCRRDQKDQRDLMFRPRFRKALPIAVDLRPHCPPVMDQGALGSCTAHGITGALRYAMIKQGLKDVPLSRLQLYYDERARERSIADDAGAEIRTGIKCAAKIGIAHEHLWPYTEGKFAVAPPSSVYLDAQEFKALRYHRVRVNLDLMKATIADGYPIIIGLTLYQSFESDGVAAKGLVPMPTKKEKDVGGHCMYVVGYGQRKGYFTVRNSWGKSWGDHGDCYFSESYLSNELLGSDYWVITLEGA